jgi:hypothetical protein
MAIPIITLNDARDQGLKFYFTGVPCPKGHISKRIVSTQSCHACKLIAKNEWYKKNKDHVNEYNSKNKEKRDAQKKQHRINNKHKYAEAAARYRKNNREKYLSNKRKYNQINYEKNKDWWKKNRIVAKVYKARRRDKSVENTIGLEHFTRKDAEALRNIQKDKCANCHVSLNGCGHLDHIMPLYLGGPNSKDNLQWLCKKCNLSKGAKHPIDWAQQNGRLL